MAQNTTGSGSQERAASGPWVTRGLRRHQEKLRRKRARVRSDALLVGIDLARERQAVSFVAGN